MRENSRILYNSAKFSVNRPHFQHIMFRPQWPLPVPLIVLGLCIP